VVTFDGQAVGDSTAIIAELEARYPDPPLYPADPVERRRALEIEDWFDENLGPFIRRLAYHEATSDPTALVELTYKNIPWVQPQTLELSGSMMKAFLHLRFGVRSREKARAAETKVLEALDRLDAELDGREYLAGDRFSVADLTAASLFYPLVFPPEGPWQPTNIPPPWLDRMKAHRNRPALKWVARTFANHRRPTPSASPHSAEATAV
jgi:glutathione S-transferase